MNRFTFFLTLMISFAASADPIEIQSGAMRAFFVVPVAHDLSLESTWIDLVACPSGKCDYLIDRIKGSELKARGGFRVLLSDDGAFQLMLKPAADLDEEVVLARSAYSSGWFPPAEICASAGTSQTCRYKLERDKAAKSLSMRIQVRK